MDTQTKSPTAYEQAQHYTSLGWALVAIPPGSKAPTDSGWQKQGKPAEHWQSNPKHSMGLLHGLSGTCALDIDHMGHTRLIFDAMNIDLDALLANYPRIVGNPERGKVLFKVPHGVTLETHKINWPIEGNPSKREVVFELRAGAVQDVLPPSIHPDTQKPYAWAGASCEDLPELPAQLLMLWQGWDDHKDQMADLCPWAAPRPQKRLSERAAPSKPPRDYGEGESVIEQYKAAVPIALALEEAGFTRCEPDRYLSPNSTSKKPGVTVDREANQAFSHHGSDDHINGEHRFDSFNLLALNHNGDLSAAAKEAAEWLGLSKARDATVEDLKMIEHGAKIWRVWTTGESWEDVEVGGPSILNGAKFHDNSRTSVFFVATEFAKEEKPPREWLVPDFVPMFTVSSLYGDGGTGKSLAALQLAVSVALGRPWLGREARAGKALFITAEDDRDELHRRLDDIAEANSVDLSDLHNLLLRSLAGEDALLSTLQKDGSQAPTPLFEEVSAYIESEKPELVVLDTLADLFSGNENDRGQARQFIGMLRGVAIRNRCAVLLLAHPSLSGMTSGTGSGGNTAWSNSVRSRMYLDRVTIKDGSNVIEDNPNLRTLTNKKANYGRTGIEIPLSWEDGVFVTVDSPTGLDAMAMRSKAERKFLEMLRMFTEQGRVVNDKNSAANAPKAFSEHPDGGGISKKLFHRAMETLLADGRIRLVDTDGPASKRTKMLEIV
ncbi:MAG: AAA family ATPase [Tateyamaria sp.]|uniref:AAA family ATPase n=1 Tax=Tateyamaria sp. TaxID=1929288 RepID=UPI00329DC1D8